METEFREGCRVGLIIQREKVSLLARHEKDATHIQRNPQRAGEHTASNYILETP